MMARNEFPLTVPPRWLSELFEVLGRAASLKMAANKGSLVAPPTLDLEPQAYIAAVSQNIGNDKRRFGHQRFKFRAQEDEAIVDDSGQPLPCPEEDAVIPRVPVGLGLHKP